MKKSSVIWIVIILVVLALGIGGYIVANNYSTTNTQNTAPGTVNIQNFSFNPFTTTINKGGTVTWQNNDSATHHIVADDGSFDLGDVVSGGTSKHTFTTAGTFKYHCSIHPSMTGVTIVK